MPGWKNPPTSTARGRTLSGRGGAGAEEGRSPPGPPQGTSALNSQQSFSLPLRLGQKTFCSLDFRSACVRHWQRQNSVPLAPHSYVFSYQRNQGSELKDDSQDIDQSEDAGLNCGFVREGSLFRYRAAAIILREGQVLMACNETDPYFYSVGGAVRLNESAQEAVVREVLEETGALMGVDRLAFVHENFFPGSEGLRWHEIALYFLMKVPPGFNPREGSLSMNGVREHMAWLPVDRLAEYTAYPAFFAWELPRLGEGVRHIMTREDRSSGEERPLTCP